MKVTIVGGWSVDSDKQEAWHLRVSDQRTRDIFIGACKLIGKALAAKGHTLVVGSAMDNSADRHVVDGFLSEYDNREVTDPLIHVIQGLDSEGDLYASEREKYQDLFQGIPSHFSGEKPRAAEKILAVRDADALIAIGGLTDTYVAGIAALVAKRPVVPIASFGGAALSLWRAIQMIGNLEESKDFNRLADEIWKPALVDAAFRFGGLDRPRIFLGYSGKAEEIAKAIHRYVESLGLRVIDWKTDFEPTKGILDELRAASFSCKYAIFLLTPDDQITVGNKSRWVPRDNVLFEVGYFINALGLNRTAVVVQDPVDVLADYRGHIYIQLPETGDISAIKIKLQQFLSSDIHEDAPGN
jgi:predicted nucleotide-binding protein